VRIVFGGKKGDKRGKQRRRRRRESLCVHRARYSFFYRAQRVVVDAPSTMLGCVLDCTCTMPTSESRPVLRGSSGGSDSEWSHGFMKFEVLDLWVRGGLLKCARGERSMFLEFEIDCAASRKEKCCAAMRSMQWIDTSHTLCCLTGEAVGMLLVKSVNDPNKMMTGCVRTRFPTSRSRGLWPRAWASRTSFSAAEPCVCVRKSSKLQGIIAMRLFFSPPFAVGDADELAPKRCRPPPPSRSPRLSMATFACMCVPGPRRVAEGS
jgi:hypothetical protein